MMRMRTSVIMAALLIVVSSAAFAQPEIPASNLPKSRAEQSNQTLNFHGLGTEQREQPGFFTVDAGGIGRRWLGNNLSGCEKMRDIAKKL